MPRFVIQEHCLNPEKSQVHWDLMLEEGSALATWRVQRNPKMWDKEEIPAEKIADHRLEYLTYEGPVSRDRGRVRIFARGEYTELEAQEKYWRVKLRGDTISGIMELQQGKGRNWMVRFQGETT